MDETELRQLEKQFKIRVKTGCETCRVRRVKCDETKPDCTRCTKTGRKCSYARTTKLKKGSSAAAASYRNPAFLVLPQSQTRTSISRSPSQSLSPVPQENRSFHYFRTHTLPKWTEYFDSELWSGKVLQLSHSEPAIKHGLLALSTMHECFENTSSVFITRTSNFALIQYMQAVRCSNDLLVAHQAGKLELEKILIACLIFTCYENLAGNYEIANMHLQNGLRILDQYKPSVRTQHALSYESIGNVLYRFDLQAMTFSVSSSPYKYDLHSPPGCPLIPEAYKSNTSARDDLVKLLRCYLWLSGISDENPSVRHHPIWFHVYAQVTGSLQLWDAKFTIYLQNLPRHEQGDHKIGVGNTLLKMYSILAGIIATSDMGTTTQMSWDGSVDSFSAVVDLAESLSTSHPYSPAPTISQPQRQQWTRSRSITANHTRHSSPTLPGTSIIEFRPGPSPSAADPPKAQRGLDVVSVQELVPTSFSPSFELSTIVPLFVVASRCRDPTVRRRAIALLLQSRRREGVWDSLGAGMVAIECLKMEESLTQVDISQDGWIPLNPMYRECNDVHEWQRVREILIGVNTAEGYMSVKYKKINGDHWEEKRPLLGIVDVMGVDGRDASGSQPVSSVAAKDDESSSPSNLHCPWPLSNYETHHL